MSSSDNRPCRETAILGDVRPEGYDMQGAIQDGAADLWRQARQSDR